MKINFGTIVVNKTLNYIINQEQKNMQIALTILLMITSICFSAPTKDEFSAAFIRVAEITTPSIVSIVSEIEIERRQSMSPFFQFPFGDMEEFFFDDFFPRHKQKGQNLGSGVIIDAENGYIITNNHVIENADEIKVITNDKKEYKAEIVGNDPMSDIAILKLEEKFDIPKLKVGNSEELQVGEWVVAIGSPFGLHLNHTVTAGIVSATGRSNVVSRLGFENFIQHDAAINPGNSGGALLNLDGELIGINTAIATDGRSRSNAGVGFAIPINQVKRVMDDLIKDGKVSRGWLGVHIQGISQEMANALKLDNNHGAIIVSVLPDSPAEIAGIKEQDVIIKIDGKKITDESDLRNIVSSKHPGESYRFTIIRDEKIKYITVTLGLRPDDQQILSSSNKNYKNYDLLGLKVSNSEQKDGVLIDEIEESSTAYHNDIRENDLITKIGKKDIKSIEDYQQAIADYNIGDTMMLRVIRNGAPKFLAFTIE